MVRPLAPALGLFLLAGCAAVGPDYHVPDQALVRSSEAQGAFTSGGSVTTAQPLPDHWWKLFNEPTLDTLV